MELRDNSTVTSATPALDYTRKSTPTISQATRPTPKVSNGDQPQHASRLPTVELIGNSLLKGVDTSRMGRQLSFKKQQAFTIPVAHNALDKMTSKPDVIAYQLLTNDAKSSPASQVSANCRSLIKDTQRKHPQAKVVFSLAPHVNDGRLNAKLRATNALLQEAIWDMKDVSCASHCNLGLNNTCLDDGIHLNGSRSSILACNLRFAAERALNITRPQRPQGPSQHRHQQRRFYSPRFNGH